MKSWIVEFLSMYEYIGLFILTMFEPLMPIISIEEMIEMSQHPMFQFTMHPIFILLVIVIGSVIGALMLYSVGLLIGIRNVEAIFKKYEKRIPFTYETYTLFLQRFERHSTWLLFFSRFIPIVRGIVCIPLGMVQMRLGTFISIAAFGSFLWTSALLFQMGLFQWHLPHIVISDQVLINCLYVFAMTGFVAILLLVVKIRRRSA